MMEKSKRGNGSTLMYVILRRDSFLSRPYMNYLSHITKVNNIRPSVDSHQNETVEQMKETLNHQRHKDHIKR
jgi:hypothetical protein